MSAPLVPASVDEVAGGLRGVGYLPGESTTLVSYLAARLGKPVLVEARTHPVVLLTSNNSREFTEALKRRCLYLWLDYPTMERELEIVRLHAPELPETVARRLVEVVAMVRDLDLKKPPSIAESIDWARALLLLGADDISEDVFRDTMSIIVKHRTDLDLVAERVGVKLEQRAAAP